MIIIRIIAQKLKDLITQWFEIGHFNIYNQKSLQQFKELIIQ